MNAFCSILAFVLVSASESAVGGEAANAGSNEESRGEDPRPFITDVFSHRLNHRKQIDLNGEWELRRDQTGEGKEQKWFSGDMDFPDTMHVPGAPQAQGIGEPHRYQRTAFNEPFWIRRTFRLPRIEPDQRVWLRVGGILPAAEVYLNGSYVGYTKSSRTQQRVDVTPYALPGAENSIVIRVCELPEIRLDGLLEWNEGTQLWRGPYRPIACEITNRVSIVDTYIQPNLELETIQLNATFSESSPTPVQLTLKVRDGDSTLGEKSVTVPSGKTSIETDVTLDPFTTWSPSHPQLYLLEMALSDAEGSVPFDKAAVRFGMREIRVEGTKFFLNGKPIFLRVYGEDHYYPDTLCPPADKEWYLTRLKRAREYGLNATKGCVETIPQDYLEACDEAGIMVIQEMPFGLSTLRANRYTIDSRFREYYSQELDGLIRVSRNHPSIVAYSMSSELEFSNQTQESFDFFSRDLVQQTRTLAPHVLAIDCTGYVNSEETDKGRRDTDFYASVHPRWMKEVLDEDNMKTDGKHPLILHEYNWWSSYPDPNDRRKYKDAQLLPFWLDILEKTAWEKGQGELIPLYRKNSQWLQTLCRKDGIEYSRRNPGVEGYILWLLVDFGHWCEGLLDDFWNPKNVSPKEFLKSNGDTVVLLAKEGERCLEMGTEAQIPLAVSHYGEDEYPNSVLNWKATGGPIRIKGSLPISALPQGEFTHAGTAEFELSDWDMAYKFEVEVELNHNGKVVNTNNWSFWAFPEASKEVCSIVEPDSAGTTVSVSSFPRIGSASASAIPADASVVLAETVDDSLTEFLERGGRCLLFSKGSAIENTRRFTGIFRTIPWNAGDSGNSGTVVSHHPALERFPHEGMCDLPFLHMLKGHYPMEFEPLREHGVVPIVRNIDHYYSNRNNAFLLEFRVGKGKALVTSLGVLENAKQEIEAGYLLDCLFQYLGDDRFDPVAEVPPDLFRELFSPPPAESEQAEGK